MQFQPHPGRTREEQIAHARACDEQIADAYAIAHKYNAIIAEATKAIRNDNKAIAQGYDSKYRRARIAKHEAIIAVTKPQHEEARHEAAIMNDALYEGWQRFFLVEHIHGNQHCSSVRPTTKVGWLTSVSGLTEAEAVAEYGPRLCTICFPTAPVEWTRGDAPAPDTCAGSGKGYNREKRTGREGAYYSPTGYCETCGEVVGLASRGSFKVRKHKNPGAAT